MPLIVRRAKCETVTEMMRQRWDVIAVCQRCGLTMEVELGTIAKVCGPGFSLWNRKARCRKVGCTGHVEFHAKAGDGMLWHEPLRAPDP